MVKKIETDQARDIPLPVRHAQAALELLRRESPDMADAVKKALPGYAVFLDRSGQDVTVDNLLAAAKLGLEYIKEQTDHSVSSHSKNISPLDSYHRIIAKRTLNKGKTLQDKLIRSCIQNNLKEVMSCLKEGASITDDENLAVRSAADNGHLDIVVFLHNYGADITDCNNEAIAMAAAGGHLDVVTFLHEHGADVAKPNNLPVMLAARSGHLDVVTFLHEHGTDITASDNFAIIWAAQMGHLDVVTFLYEHGADITADENGAAKWAAQMGHLDVLTFLYNHGADITAGNNAPVRLAAEAGHLDVVAFLHENGADITAFYNGALRAAAAHGHLEVVAFLHDHGADITALDNEALDTAVERRHLDVVRYLCDKGAEMGAGYSEIQMALKEYDQGISLWQKTLHMEPPKGLYKANPALFKKSAYEFILPLLESEGYSGQEANRMAFNTAALFQSKNRVLQYLDRWGELGLTPLHDLVHAIKLPMKGKPNLKNWGDAVLKCGPSMAKLVKFADKVSSPCRSNDGKTWSMPKTRAECAKFAFRKAAEHPSLAALCFEYSVDEEDFEKALKIAKKGPAESKSLPEITIDGSRFGKEGARFTRLPLKDIRGLFLGEITNCCQSIGSHAHDCAEYGYGSKDGGFYVVENAKGQIVAQTFAWMGNDDSLCFDTLETLGSDVTAEQWTNILKAVSEDLTAKKDVNITRLTVGLGGGTPSKQLKQAFKKANRPATPKNYRGYTEAAQQVTVWKARGRNT